MEKLKSILIDHKGFCKVDNLLTSLALCTVGAVIGFPLAPLMLKPLFSLTLLSCIYNACQHLRRSDALCHDIMFKMTANDSANYEDILRLCTPEGTILNHGSKPSVSAHVSSWIAGVSLFGCENGENKNCLS